MARTVINVPTDQGTVKLANAAAVAGDAIHLEGGTYTGDDDCNETLTAGVELYGDGQFDSIIDPASATKTGITLSGNNHVHDIGIHAGTSLGVAIQMGNTGGNHVEDAQVHGNADSISIGATAGRNWLTRIFLNDYGADGILVAGGTVWVRDCTGMATAGSGVTALAPLRFTGGTVFLEANKFHLTGGDSLGLVGMTMSGASGIVCSRNNMFLIDAGTFPAYGVSIAATAEWTSTDDMFHLKTSNATKYGLHLVSDPAAKVTLIGGNLETITGVHTNLILARPVEDRLAQQRASLRLYK